MITSVTVKITQELDRRVRVLAAEHDQNRSEFIRQAVEEKVVELTRPVPEKPLSGQDAHAIAITSEASATDQAGDTLSSERGESIIWKGNAR
jgi:metal-responsive CopG/Arc/MetJ family transcriptional regulator